MSAPPLRQRRRRASTPPTLASPLRILTQIALLQLAYYACGTALILFTALVAGTPFSPALVLSWRAVRGDTAVGWTLGLCWMLDSAFGYVWFADPCRARTHSSRTAADPFVIVHRAIFLLLFIARSKLVPDFALTLHGLHLVATSLYVRAPPTNLLWWALQAASAALMISLGIWACRWRELRPLSFGGGAVDGATKPKKTPALPPRGDGGAEDDEEEEDENGLGVRLGLGKMLGMLRGRDGIKGEYEMVGMGPREAG